jgi:PAS domain-containing protein
MGGTVGAVGILREAPPAAGGHAGILGLPAPLAAVGAAAVLVLPCVAALFLRPRRRREPSFRPGISSSARDEIASTVRAAARRYGDPVVIAPVLERSVERAVGRSGSELAIAIGERIAEKIAARMGRGAPPPAAAPALPATGLGEAAGAVLQDEAFPLAVVAVNRRMEIVAWNPAAERLWAAPAASRLGKAFGADGLFGLEGELRIRLRRILEGGPVEAPVRLSFDRDQVLHVQVTVLPVRPAGSPPGAPPEGALVAAENVSARVESEIAAKILGQYQKALSASLPIPLVVVDSTNRIMSWNAAAEGLFGVAERDALGKELSALPSPADPHLSLPFRSPEDGNRGAIHIYGSAARVIAGGADAAPAAAPPTAAPAGGPEKPLTVDGPAVDEIEKSLAPAGAR